MRADLLPLAGSWLLTYLLHSTLLLALAALLTHRLVRSPALRDLLWKTALVGGLVTSTVQVGSGWRPLSGAYSLVPSSPAPAQNTAGERWQGILPENRELASPRATRTNIAPAAPVTVRLEAVESPVTAREPTEPLSPIEWMLLGWGVLGVAFLGRYIGQRIRVLRRIGPRTPVEEPVIVAMLETLRHTASVAQPVQLTSAAGLSSPVALGRAEIALPQPALTELDRDQQRSMLAHELAHLVRRDPSWLTAACVIERLFFLQPLNRLARVRMQEAAELLCDDWAVNRTGSGFSLASCLVKVAEWVDTPPHPVPLAGMAEHRSQLVTRIHRLIEGRPMPTAPRSLWFAAGAVALLGMTSIAAPGVTSREQQDPMQQGSVPPATLEADVPAAEPESEVTADELMAAAAIAGVSDTDSVLTSTTRDQRLMREYRSAEWRARADLRRELARSRMAVAGTPRPPRAPHPPEPAVYAKAPHAPTPPGGWAGPTKLDIARAWGHESRKSDTTNIAVPALIAALKDSDVEVRRIAVQSLSNYDDPRAVPGLVSALKDTDAEVRIGAALALGNLGDERALPGLLGALKDGDREVRRSALSALHSMPNKVPDEAILTALGDSDAEVRQEAINLAVSRMSEYDEEGGNAKVDSRFISAFGRLLADANAEIRQQAALGLGAAGLTEPPAALLAASKDKSADVRVSVADALGSIGGVRSVATLREMLTDPNADVRESSVHALSSIRDQSALEALVGALKSTDPVVRRNAAEALGSRDDH